MEEGASPPVFRKSDLFPSKRGLRQFPGRLTGCKCFYPGSPRAGLLRHHVGGHPGPAQGLVGLADSCAALSRALQGGHLSRRDRDIGNNLTVGFSHLLKLLW